MLVQVEALDAFVTFLPDGEPVSCIRGERVQLPKATADKLIKGNLAVACSARVAPENKADGPAPEVKTAPKRAAKKAAPPAE